MESLSESYGWTPSQIRKEKFSDLENYLDIISMKQRIEKEMYKKKK
jgi:hypothetical protein